MLGSSREDFRSRVSRATNLAMKKYLIVIEETGSGYLAYSPDMPGCVCSGRTRNEAETNLGRALVSHLQNLRACGEVLPAPHTYSAYLELP
jgi:predicted RNase H-like HicB family nuclease